MLYSSALNNSVVENNHSNTKFGSRNRSNSKNTKLIRSWIKNTPKKMGFPKSVVKYIGKYLIKNNLKSDVGSKIITTITQIKVNVNMRYKGVYGSDYYKNETNPYLKKGGLFSSLRNIFRNNLDLKQIIAMDYMDYIDDNSDLPLKDNKANKQLKQDKKFYSGWNLNSYVTNLECIRKNMKKDKNDPNKLTKDKLKFRKMIHLACKYTDLEPEYIKGTKSYNKNSAKKWKASQQQADQYHPHINNQIQHVTVHPDVFTHKKKIPQYDMSKF